MVLAAVVARGVHAAMPDLLPSTAHGSAEPEVVREGRQQSR
jgi:hypothetical protein